jgi:hypothetical protein
MSTSSRRKRSTVQQERVGLRAAAQKRLKPAMLAKSQALAIIVQAREEWDNNWI